MPDDEYTLDAPPTAKKKKAPKPKAAPDLTIQRLFAVYATEFRRKWNPCAAHRATGCRRCGDAWALLDPAHEVKPLYAGGRDAKHLKELSQAWGEADVAQLIRDFFASTDPRVVRSDYKIAVIFSMAQTLKLDAQGRVAPDPRTADNLRAARQATRPKE